MEREYRLTPDMSSRKLQVVSFVQQYIARWGCWPSYGEIAGAMGIGKWSARDAVRRAVRDKLLQREPGSRKSVVTTVSAMPRPSPVDASVILDQLRSAGVVIHEATARAPTFHTLPRVPPFEHMPHVE